MSLSKEPPYNNDKQWITLYIKYTYRPVMWVRKLLNVTYWTGRSGKWLCYSLKTVQTVDRNEWCTDDEMRLNIYYRNTIKTRDIFDTNVGSWRRSVNVAFIPSLLDAGGWGWPPCFRTLVTGAHEAMCAALVFFPHFRRYTRTCRSSLSLSQLRRAVRGRLCFAVTVC